MAHPLPKKIFPVFTILNKRSIRIGLQDIRTMDVVDCKTYVSDQDLTHDRVLGFGDDYRNELKDCGVI